VIGVLTTSYPRWPGDPAGSFVEARVRALRAGGAAVEVLAAGPTPGLDPTMSAPGLAIHRVGFAVPGLLPLFYGAGAPEAFDAGAGGAWLQGARFFAGLAQVLRARAAGWSAVESHWLVPCGLLAATLAPGLPHRAHAHSGDVALLERLPLGAALAGRLHAAGAEIVCASEDLRRRLARLLGARAAERLSVEAATSPLCAAGPPSPEERRRLRGRLGLAGPTLLAVGRLVPIKGYDVLVRAVGRLPPERRPEVVIVGEGPERARLERLAAERRVRLRLTGALPPAEVGAWLGASDLFVHPCRPLPGGRTEGSPVAVREALAAGLPVLASASGGLPELAAGANKVDLIAPDSPAALAAALARLALC
jgi:hypothetical protein